ncbi:MAG: NADH-quinone oxidoreductase subunit NuoN, partial [Rickettsiales bacterium]
MIETLASVGIGAIAPEIFLLLSTIFLLLFGLYRAPHINAPFIVVSLLVLSFTVYMATCSNIPSGVFLNGMFSSNDFTVFAKILVLISGGLVLMMSSGFLCEDGGRPFEFIILMLFALLGMMLMISAADLLSLYMALEMSSLALYVLASFNRDHAKSSEAGLKYFVLGALASGMMLYGMSLVYGFAGSTSFVALGDLFNVNHTLSKGVVLGLILMMVGFCFKLSAVPFHMWTPDVYEGAPTPVTAFFATAPKIAALALFTRLLLEPFAHAIDEWQQIVVFVSLASMLVGAFGAITQTNIKRLLAYSSIGHVGFMLMALAVGNQSGVQAILIYLSVYVFMSVGMFGSVLLMKRDGKSVENIKDLSGLSQTNPALAAVMAICIFSMAGIPPMAGFFGKMYVVFAAIEGGLTWLAVVGVCITVI